MYITINSIIGEKRMDQSYSIWGKEVAVVSVFSDNIQYKFTEDWTIDLPESRSKPIASGTYTRRELIDLVEEKIEMTQFDKHSRINRKNKLAGITEVAFNLDELSDTNNLENGKPGNNLLTLHIM